MPKYNFDRIGPQKFQEMAQGLIEGIYRIKGHLIQFGNGKDGAREATWIDPSTSETWIFQVKYHEITATRTKRVSEVLISDLEKELEKVANKYKHQCDHYVLITNIQLSSAFAGGRDQIEQTAKKYSKMVPNIEVWDTVQLCSMLDNNEEVRTSYLDQVLPGDILSALLRRLTHLESRTAGIIRTYLENLIETAGATKSDEAGDEAENALRLEDVYIDLTLSIDTRSHHNELTQDYFARMFRTTRRSISNAGEDLTLPASLAVLLAPSAATLIEAGPGFGKSTIGQFAAVFHAMRLIEPQSSSYERLAKRLTLPTGYSSSSLDAECPVRLPFRIELRRYAQWRQGADKEGIAQYIAEELINKNTNGSLSKDDVFDLARKNSVLLILDGLDEVPNLESRQTITADARLFLQRCRVGERADVQLILSTRPQGYNGEFDKFQPLNWKIADLSDVEFSTYCNDWLSKRVKDKDERADALARVTRGMNSPEVRSLATTLLQATVILTIAKNKHDIPHQRGTLFKKYVDVIFDREKEKWPLVKEYEPELRRLHELTGYELHKSMEKKGGGSTVGEKEFEALVMRTWLLYRGEHPLPEGIRPIVQDITKAARDRLVFLKGEGKEQSQIGFLISSFREYFAASYLHLHERANRESVFRELLKRDAHWENVLRFYAGFQNSSDQRHWANCIDEIVTGESAAERLHKATRYRRMLVRLLPEFQELSKITLGKAIDQVLQPETLWTWGTDREMVAILKAFKRGDFVSPAIQKLLAASTDLNSQRISLSLAVQVAPRDGELCERVLDAVRVALKNSHLRRSALELVFSQDLSDVALDITGNELVVALGKEYRGHTTRAVANRLSSRTTVEAWLEYPWIVEHMAENPLANMLRESGSSLHPSRYSGPHGHGGLLTRWTAPGPTFRSHHAALGRSAKSCGSATGPAVDAFLSLLATDEDPYNVDLYNEAITKLASLKPHISSTIYDLIGPRLDYFPNPQEWMASRRLLREDPENKRQDEVRHLFDDSEAAWFRALFHPKAWPMLSGNGRCTPIDQSQFGTALAKSTRALCLFNFIRLETHGPNAGTRFPLFDLLQSALNVIEGMGAWAIASMPPVILIGDGDIQVPSWSRAKTIMERAWSKSDWPYGWRSWFLLLGALAEDCEVSELSDFWERAGRLQVTPLIGHATTMRKSVIHRLSRVIDSALDAKGDVEFAVEIARLSDGPILPDTGRKLSAVIIKDRNALCDPSLRRRRVFLQQPFCEGEDEIWCEPKLIAQLSVDDDEAERKLAGHPEDAREGAPISVVSYIIEHQAEYPLEVAEAALRRFNLIKSIQAGPLLDTHWMISED